MFPNPRIGTGPGLGTGGFIELNKALCMTAALINAHMLLAARDARLERFFNKVAITSLIRQKETSASRSKGSSFEYRPLIRR
jgi:hypothetical protein